MTSSDGWECPQYICSHSMHRRNIGLYIFCWNQVRIQPLPDPDLSASVPRGLAVRLTMRENAIIIWDGVVDACVDELVLYHFVWPCLRIAFMFFLLFFFCILPLLVQLVQGCSKLSFSLCLCLLLSPLSTHRIRALLCRMAWLIGPHCLIIIQHRDKNRWNNPKKTASGVINQTTQTRMHALIHGHKPCRNSF